MSLSEMQASLKPHWSSSFELKRPIRLDRPEMKMLADGISAAELFTKTYLEPRKDQLAVHHEDDRRRQVSRLKLD